MRSSEPGYQLDVKTMIQIEVTKHFPHELLETLSRRDVLVSQRVQAPSIWFRGLVVSPSPHGDGIASRAFSGFDSSRTNGPGWCGMAGTRWNST